MHVWLFLSRLVHIERQRERKKETERYKIVMSATKSKDDQRLIVGHWSLQRRSELLLLGHTADALYGVQSP